MAHRINVRLTDDIDGSPADTTVSFTIDGISREIDLSASHAQEFRGAMQRFIAAARRTAGPSRQAGRATDSGASPAAIRHWAITKGIKVSARGRLPDELIATFRQDRGS
jgi:hypothetical protein